MGAIEKINIIIIIIMVVTGKPVVYGGYLQQVDYSGNKAADIL